MLKTAAHYNIIRVYTDYCPSYKDAKLIANKEHGGLPTKEE